MIGARGFGVQSPTAAFAPIRFDRRDPEPEDVVIAILYCGICHTDVHIARDDWAATHYPCVPGHEIVGRVLATGSEVTRFAVGDIVGVGCMVDSCLHCSSCDEGLEQYCAEGFTATYNGKSRTTGEITHGGYSDRIVVRQEFVLRIRHGEDQLPAVAPLLCAGITTWSPLRHWNVGPGKKVGVIGVGGLGHMAIRLASALGAHVVAFTTSPEKSTDARRLGAAEIVLSNDPDALARHARSLDLILDTAAASHDLRPSLGLLARDGAMVLLGAPRQPHDGLPAASLISQRRSLAGSLIGGIAETQEMLDFCADRGIVADVEMVSVQEIDSAYDRIAHSQVRYRFVIDLASLDGEE